MPPPVSTGLRILIVEDHIDCAESMASLLRLYGHEVETSHDGRGGLAMAWAFEPDVVLLDLGLPGIDGYEVARELTRPRPAHTPLVVAVTGYGGARERILAAEAGVDAYLVKPVDGDELQGLLSRFQRLLYGLAG